MNKIASAFTDEMQKVGFVLEALSAIGGLGLAHKATKIPGWWANRHKLWSGLAAKASNRAATIKAKQEAALTDKLNRLRYGS